MHNSQYQSETGNDKMLTLSHKFNVIESDCLIPQERLHNQGWKLTLARSPEAS